MLAALTDRSIISVTGPDAKDFLQNIMTNDVEKATGDAIVYSCLLTPQGQILNEFFVVQGTEAGSYWIDIETVQRDNLIRRLGFFKLRAKVSIAPDDTIRITAMSGKDAGETGGRLFADPRLAALGFRHYDTAYLEDAGDMSNYDDLLISQAVPNGSKTIRLEKDVSADANLDLLQAIAWDKGCFIGQEVAARMYHRNLNKKRLLVIDTAAGLEPGQILKKNGVEAGEVRQLSSSGQQALAQIKISFLPETEESRVILDTDAAVLSITKPGYFPRNQS